MELKELKEGVYELNQYQELKKDKSGKYRVIYPVKKDGKYVWKNLLKIDITVLILLIALVLVMYNNSINLEECSEIIENADEFCESLEPDDGGFVIEDVIGEEHQRYSIGLD